MRAKVRVLVVDDSLVSQKLYRKAILHDGRFELLDIASDGRQAVRLVETEKPDVVSMDINMPLMDGIEATRLIMQTHPVPILIVSSLYNPEEQGLAMNVLEAGAVGIMPKPYGMGHVSHSRSIRNYLNMLYALSEVKVVRRKHFANQIVPRVSVSLSSADQQHIDGEYRLLVIGASAGGPESLKTILAALTPSFPLPVMIVQHIEPSFVEGFHIWLQSYSGIAIELVQGNSVLQPGRAYLAPANHHLVVSGFDMAALNQLPPIRGHRPSVGQLFRSAGDIYGKQVIAVILSGMGSDGAAELKFLKDLGALTFAQNKESCLVYGMPGEAVRLGGASVVTNPLEIVNQIKKIC